MYIGIYLHLTTDDHNWFLIKHYIFVEWIALLLIKYYIAIIITNRMLRCYSASENLVYKYIVCFG